MPEITHLPIFEVREGEPVVVPDIMMPGRGSEPDGDGRTISLEAQQRVDTLGALLDANAEALERHRWQRRRDESERKVLAGFLGGWARGAGERRPADEAHLEAHINLDYAHETGIVRRHSKAVEFYTQPDSYSTFTDFAFAWRGWRRYGLPRRPGKFYTPKNPLIIIAQDGTEAEKAGLDEEAQKRTGHMGRCLDGAHVTGRIAYDALLPVVAPGEDDPTIGMSEAALRRKMHWVMLGALGRRDAVLREKGVFLLLEAAQRLGD